MAERSTLARPYARAAFSAAQATGSLTEWSAMLRTLATVMALPAVQSMASNVNLGSVEKAEKIASLCQEDMVNGGGNLLEVMAEQGRLSEMEVVFEQFESLRLAAENTADVIISSAFALNNDQLTLLQDKLKTRFGRAVSIKTVIDPTLKAGAVIRYGDTVIDGSARGRLFKLAEAMNS
jgi:F-type H+-transporting ATPase subunit delta